jgi:thioredoxin 1
MIDVTAENWDSEVLEGGLVLVEFWADWCQPCKMQKNVLQQLERDVPRIKIVLVDTDANPDLVEVFGINSLPTMSIYKDGKQVLLLTGAKPLGSLVQELAKFI